MLLSDINKMSDKFKEKNDINNFKLLLGAYEAACRHGSDTIDTKKNVKRQPKIEFENSEAYYQAIYVTLKVIKLRHI